VRSGSWGRTRPRSTAFLGSALDHAVNARPRQPGGHADVNRPIRRLEATRPPGRACRRPPRRRDEVALFRNGSTGAIPGTGRGGSATSTPQRSRRRPGRPVEGVPNGTCRKAAAQSEPVGAGMSRSHRDRRYPAASRWLACSAAPVRRPPPRCGHEVHDCAIGSPAGPAIAELDRGSAVPTRAWAASSSAWGGSRQRFYMASGGAHFSASQSISRESGSPDGRAGGWPARRVPPRSSRCALVGGDEGFQPAFHGKAFWRES